MDDQNATTPMRVTPPRPSAPDGRKTASPATEPSTEALPAASNVTPGEPTDDASGVTTPLPDDNPVLDRFWIAVRRLPRYLKLAVALGRDPRVPKRAKAILSVGAVYTLSPLDLIPGIIPVAGQLDDLLVMLVSLRQAIHACPPDLAAEHLSRQGLTKTDFDADLSATRDTATWLAKRGASAAGRLARRTGRFLRSTVSNRFATNDAER